MNYQEFEAELQREGYRVVNTSQVPNKRVENHCHDFDAKVLVLGGEITITRENKAETFRAGQCFMVPVGCMHAEHVGQLSVIEPAVGMQGHQCPAFASNLEGQRLDPPVPRERKLALDRLHREERLVGVEFVWYAVFIEQTIYEAALEKLLRFAAGLFGDLHGA